MVVRARPLLAQSCYRSILVLVVAVVVDAAAYKTATTTTAAEENHRSEGRTKPATAAPEYVKKQQAVLPALLRSTQVEDEDEKGQRGRRRARGSKTDALICAACSDMPT